MGLYKEFAEDEKRQMEKIISEDYKKADKKHIDRMQELFVYNMIDLERDIGWAREMGAEVDIDVDTLLKGAVSCGLFRTVSDLVSKTNEIEAKYGKERGKKREEKGYADSVNKKIEKYMKEGMTEEEAKNLIGEEFLRKAGYEQCSVCGEFLDPKKTDIFIKEGRCYCIGCWNKKRNIGSPFKVAGHEIKCAKCGKPIMIGDLVGFQCPPGENERTSLKCKWYCESCWDGATIEEKKKWRKEL